MFERQVWYLPGGASTIHRLNHRIAAQTWWRFPPSRDSLSTEGDRSMLSPHVILNFIQARPFRPFRIHMASGDTFDVTHPEMVHVGRNTLHRYSFVSDHPENEDRLEVLSLMLMERISPIATAVTPEQV
jgi:hypothetical protein